MFDFIENLRAKPRGQRVTITFLASILLTALIFTGWAFNTIYLSSDSSLSKEEKQSFITPLASLKSGFDKSFEVLLNELSNFRTSINDTFSEPSIYENLPESAPETSLENSLR